MPLVCSAVADGAGQRAALADHGDRGVLHLLEVQRRRLNGQHASAAEPTRRPGSSAPSTATLCCAAASASSSGVLLAAFVFLEAGAEHDGVADTLRAALRDDARHGVRRRDHERDVGRFRQLPRWRRRPSGLRSRRGWDSPDRRVPRKPCFSRTCTIVLRALPRCGDAPTIATLRGRKKLSKALLSVMCPLPVRRAHRPLKLGVRFSLKAVTASA